MTSTLDTSGPSNGDRARAQAYHRDFWPGIVGYALVLAAVLAWGHLDGSSGWRYVWAALPVLPALLVVRAVARHLRRVDDYQRMLLLQSLSVGFGTAMAASLTLGFLGIAGLPMTAAGWIVYSIGMGGWIVGTVLVRRR